MNDVSSYRVGVRAPAMISWTTIIILVAFIVLLTNPTLAVYAVNLIVPIADVVCRVAMHILLSVRYVIPSFLFT